LSSPDGGGTPRAGAKATGQHLRQKDIACDTGDREVFEAVAKILPRTPYGLQAACSGRIQTAEAIWATGFPKPAAMPREAPLPNRISDQWQGMNPPRYCQPAGPAALVCRHQRTRARRREFLWIFITAPAARSSGINAEHGGRDVIAVGHGGTIKRRGGLALGGQPERGLAFDIDNCSVTRLDTLQAPTKPVAAADGQPATMDRDARHAAMHQPAGPEVVPEAKLA